MIEIDGEDEDEDHYTEEEKDLVYEDGSEMMMPGSIIGNNSFMAYPRAHSPIMSFTKANFTPAPSIPAKLKPELIKHQIKKLSFKIKPQLNTMNSSFRSDYIGDGEHERGLSHDFAMKP